MRGFSKADSQRDNVMVGQQGGAENKRLGRATRIRCREGDTSYPITSILALMTSSGTPYKLLGAALISGSMMHLAGCTGLMQRSGQASLGIMPGVINNPGNRSLRRGILRYGLEQFCATMTHRGAPLKMRDDQPIIGRFFARSCTSQELANGDVFVQFSGLGYAWTNITWRVGFDAGGAIQYDQDFLMEGSTMYAYFRTRTIASTSFNTLMVERAGSNGAAALGGFANPIAKQVVESQLTRGFTVIRDSSGNVEFGLGVIERGEHPAKPFTVRGSDRMTLVNERTEVQGQQLDFLGPFEVDSDGRALFVAADIDGVPAVDVLVTRKDVGDAWLDTFIRKPGVPQPPQPSLMADVVPIRVAWQRSLPVAKGHYYVVVDNSSAVGTVAPPRASSSPLLPGVLAPSDPAAAVNAVVQMGDAP